MNYHECINFTLTPNLGIPFTWQELSRPGARHRLLLAGSGKRCPFSGGAIWIRAESIFQKLNGIPSHQERSAFLSWQPLDVVVCFILLGYHLCISPCIQGRRQPQRSQVAYPGIYSSFYINRLSLPSRRSDSGWSWTFLWGYQGKGQALYSRG